MYSDQELECRQHDGEEFIGYQHMYDTLGVIRDEYQNFYNWTVDFLASRRNVTKKNLFRDLIGMENGRKETMLLQSFDGFQQIYEMYGAEWGKAAVEKYMSSAVEDTINSNYISSLFNVVISLPSLRTVKVSQVSISSSRSWDINTTALLSSLILLIMS